MRIGIEAHVGLSTKSKVFCSCPTAVSEEPNTNVCETCLGLPGSKPVLNKEALNQAIKVALALNCNIAKETFFSRKNYFYPDLSKNFQITQYEIPIGQNGEFEKIKIKRIHLEEDPGALIHKGSTCLIDYNRSGIPLIEIVTEPDFKSPNEVRLFLRNLITMLGYLNVYSRKNEATMKADANISTTGAKVEIKNITGLREIERALEYEAGIQEKEPSKKQETKRWDSESQKTTIMRTKETEDDYGYIMDSDLPKFEISKELISQLKSEIPELGLEKTSRFQKQYKLKKEDSEILASEKKLAELFEEVAKKINPELAAKWLIRDLQKIIHKNKITDKTVKDLLIELIKKPFSPKEYVKKHNLEIVSGNLIDNMCKEVVKENLNAVEDYKKGNEKSIHFLTGQVLRKSKGTANPKEVEKILKNLI